MGKQYGARGRTQSPAAVVACEVTVSQRGRLQNESQIFKLSSEVKTEADHENTSGTDMYTYER